MTIKGVMHQCGKGDIYRIWPCKDADIKGRRKAWPKPGEPCNQVYCRHYRNIYRVDAEVVSNKMILDYTKGKRGRKKVAA